MELSSELCGDLNGEEIQKKRGCVQIYSWLALLQPETNTTLWSSHTPIKTYFLKRRKAMSFISRETQTCVFYVTAPPAAQARPAS